jgi:regulatory protein
MEKKGPTPEAYPLAIRLIGMRDHSRAEIESKLRRKGCAPADILNALQKLERAGLLDDLAYGRNCLESITRHKPTGKMKLRTVLLGKGLPEEVVGELLRDFNGYAPCRAAAEKKLRMLHGTPEEKRKALETFLRNRGFDWNTIGRTLSELHGTGEESTDQD